MSLNVVLTSNFGSEAPALIEALPVQEVLDAQLLPFHLPESYGGYTVYNVSTEFMDGDRRVLWARVEHPEHERSEVWLFDAETREPVEGAHRFIGAQDAYNCGLVDDGKGNKWHVFGMVKFEVDETGKPVGYSDVFYRYKDTISELSPHGQEPVPFALGVRGWKDTRIVDLGNGVIGVTARPQGIFGRRGEIGYFETTIDRLEEDLAAFALRSDPNELIPGLFRKAEPGALNENGDPELDDWGGPNQIWQDKDDPDIIHVVGHYATHQRNMQGQQTLVRDYAGIYFAFNRRTRQVVAPMTIIIQASDFPLVKTKHPATMGNIVFPAGLMATDEPDWSVVACGIGDRETGVALIANPQRRYQHSLI
jgi:hypothetical protein